MVAILVSIFGKTTGKKVDEIVPLAGWRGGKTQLSAGFYPRGKFGFFAGNETGYALTSYSRCERRLI